MTKENGNERFQRELLDDLRSRLGDAPDLTWYAGPFEINDYSSCFPLRVGDNEYYVKVPKGDLLRKTAAPENANDFALGRNEYESLSLLHPFWADKPTLRVIEPVLYLEEKNALVTKRICGSDWLHKLRPASITGRLSTGQIAGIRDQLFGIGQQLSTLSSISTPLLGSPKATDRLQGLRSKMLAYTERLLSFHVDPKTVSEIRKRVETLNWEAFQDQELVCTFKGLDIRNILMDTGGELFLLDPGKPKLDFREADLGRFLVTFRLIHWGTYWFFLRLKPPAYLEQAVLDGYRTGAPFDAALLRIHLAKELLKHWIMALEMVRIRFPLTALRFFLQKSYIDPFYRRELNLDISPVF